MLWFGKRSEMTGNSRRIFGTMACKPLAAPAPDLCDHFAPGSGQRRYCSARGEAEELHPNPGNNVAMTWIVIPHSGGSSNKVGSSSCGIEILLLLAGVKPNSDAIRIMISA